VHNEDSIAKSAQRNEKEYENKHMSDEKKPKWKVREEVEERIKQLHNLTCCKRITTRKVWMIHCDHY
jgi:hypothetical protein